MREKAKSRKESSGRSASPSNAKRAEVLGILFIALAVFTGLALFSFSPSDPSLNSSYTSHSPVQNLGGVIGAYTADALISIFGIASYLVVFVFFVLGSFFFRESPPSLKITKVFLLFFFLTMTSIFCQLQWKTIPLGGEEIMAGGLVGTVIAEPLRTYLNPVGAYLVVLALSLLTFVWGTGISIAKAFIFLRRFVAACFMKAKSLVVIYSARLQKAWEKYQEEKKIAQSAREKEAAEKEKAKKLVPVKITIPKAPAPPLHVPEKALKLLPKEKVLEAEKEIKPEPHSLDVLGEPKVFARADMGRETKKLEDQLSFAQMMKGFLLPPLSLLDTPELSEVTVDEESLKRNSKLLEKKLMDFGVEGRVTEIHPGPVITMYEFEPAAGIKVSKIVNLEDDLTLAMGGRSVRIVSHLQGKPAVGIEIPNHQRETVYLKEILADDKFGKAESKLTLCLGKDIEGLSFVSDLQKMPHLLVAGATGAGKSVCLNAIILSMLYKATPEEVRFIFVDPKMLELSIYQGIPHLLLPVVTEPKKAAVSLRWAVAEMERRYKLLSHAQVRNLAGYNKKIEKGLLKDEAVPVPMGSEGPVLKHDQKLPFIVIIIDELADLMMVAGREVEEYITRLAQMARAAGIHLILATQRPSVDVITGIIKANFPARISFKVSSAHDSRTILDTIGSEHLLGMGDMLFLPPGVAKILRVHGAFVADNEVMRVVEHLKKQGKPIYDETLLNFKDTKETTESDEPADELYDQAVTIVTETRQASISMVQRRLRIGYNRAARLIEKMEAEGIVGPADGAKGREVLVSNFAE